jgi:hypothetical protein
MHFDAPISVLIDPKALEVTEFHAVRRAFLGAGYLLRSAEGWYANAQAVHYLTTFLPCDFIFYSTHCGEVEGRRVTATYTVPLSGVTADKSSLIYVPLLSIFLLPFAPRPLPRFIATMDALTAALCGSSFPCAHDMNSAPYPRQLSRFKCSSL